MYYIKLSVDPTLLTNETVRFYVNATLPPPPNAVCATATDVTTGQEITGNVAFTTFDIPTIDVQCGLYTVDNPTLWYKVTNTLPSQVAINASPCNNFTTVDTIITVFEGNNSCTNLDSTCVGSVDDDFVTDCFRTAEYVFLAKPLTSYYIAVQTFDETGAGNVTLSIDAVKNYFTLIDANLDQTIGVIRNGYGFDYTTIASSRLNIEAVFDDDNINVQSVMVGFDDDPKYSRCERKAPYSIFKDRGGDFWDGTISSGSHTITATSYSQPDCKGEEGQSFIETLSINECANAFSFYKVSTGG